MGIADGSRVKIHYTLKVDDEVVDTSSGNEPLDYIHGQGQIIPGLEEHLIGLAVGDRKEVTVAPEKGYGTHDPQGVHEVPISAFQSAENLKVGDIVSGRAEDRSFQARVIAIGNENITIDMNHPLAGKTLHFAIEVMAIA
jgi:FKBP-type peptidyl-prolyl cis-trans isomerase SlyD